VGLRASALFLFGVVMMNAIAPSLAPWSRIALPEPARLVGVVIALLCIPPLVAWTQRALGDNVTTTVTTRAEHTLVTRGPYRWVRHPLYTLGLTLFLSLALISASWLLAAGIGLAYVFVLRRTPIEEAKLAERFGEAYRSYQRRTGPYLPRIRLR
jgi:protein-S-isoprenylcysteine O-methyltransferase Ste14